MTDTIADSRVLPSYLSHKTVQAFLILSIAYVEATLESLKCAELQGAGELRVVVSAAYVAKHKPEIDGYYVLYADGYESWSPRAVFDAGHEPAPAVPWDTQIRITSIGDGQMQFEGHMNPLKTIETTDRGALVFTEFLANQFPELAKMASLSYAAQQQTQVAAAPANDASQLVGADGLPIAA
jgi:hypothetical protein